MYSLERPVLRKLHSRGRPSALKFRSSLSEIYHENTKLTPLSGRAYGQQIAGFLRSKVATSQAAQPYKVYSLADRAPLPAVEPASAVETAIALRRSCRSFTGEALRRDELSRLLFFAYGRTDPRGRFRAVASGGALYPLEIYVIPNRVKGLERWVYHYDPEHHRLDVVARTDRWAELRECVWLNDMKDPDAAAALLVVTAIFERTRQKYLDRGYRLVLFEAGEVAQNLSLMTTSLGLGGYLLGGFLDDRLSAVLGIDGSEEAPLVPMALGRPASEAGADGEAAH